MVEVLERRAREPTGPIKAPRTYPGPGSPANRVLARVHSQPRQRLRLSYVLFHHDFLISRLFALLTDCYSPRQQAKAGEAAQLASNLLPVEDIGRADLFGLQRRLEIEVEARGAASAVVGGGYEHAERSNFERGGGVSDRLRIEKRCCEQNKVTRGEDKWWWEKVVPQKRAVVSAGLEDRAEPRKGSLGRSETGERNVAKRRHGRPCGQQSMDEINGHCPQGEEASRFGLCRCRRFRCSGLCDYWQQRPDAQSVSHTTATLFFLLLSFSYLF